MHNAIIWLIDFFTLLVLIMLLFWKLLLIFYLAYNVKGKHYLVNTVHHGNNRMRKKNQSIPTGKIVAFLSSRFQLLRTSVLVCMSVG